MYEQLLKFIIQVATSQLNRKQPPPSWYLTREEAVKWCVKHQVDFKADGCHPNPPRGWYWFKQDDLHEWALLSTYDNKHYNVIMSHEVSR